MFKKKNITCDVCGLQNNKQDDFKDVCNECFAEHFEKKLPLETQVEKKMDQETKQVLEETKPKQVPTDTEGYLDWTNKVQ